MNGQRTARIQHPPSMRAPGLPTLDQLRVFIQVMDSGSFSAAAKRLSRSQSVISYTIAKLEAQLNVPLFERSKRKLTLTEAGQFLLADARSIGQRLDAMRARALALNEGQETEVSLAVDTMYPHEALTDVLKSFHQRFPALRLRLRIESQSAVGQLVMQQCCAIGISGPASELPDALERRALTSVALTAVVGPAHPLAQLSGALPGYVLREHIQLVLTERGEPVEGLPSEGHGNRDWRLCDIETKHQLLREGVGWGYMPVSRIGADLAAGRLIQLKLAGGALPPLPMQLIYRVDNPPGQAGRWLMQQMLAQHQ
jgi:DNA-binding transcriptional LysR family regulator